MNATFDTITIRNRSDWVEAARAIKAHDLDLLIVDHANVPAGCGEKLRERALQEGLGICAAVTLTSFQVLGGPGQCVWSAGRRIVSALGSTCELSNIGFGDLPSRVKARATYESIWGSAVYIRREALSQLDGFDLNLIRGAETLVPNILWDDLCLQAFQKGIAVSIHPEVHAFIDPAATTFPDDTHPGYARWEKKWGWNPLYPNLYKIRSQWQGTPLVRGMLDELMDAPWPTAQPAVDGIMLTMDSLPKLRLTLAALAKTEYQNFRLIVLMNGSSQPVRDELEFQKDKLPFPVKLLDCPVNVGVSPGLNWLVSQCTAPIIARLDDDIEMPPTWLAQMVSVLQRHPFCGAVLPSWQIPMGNGAIASLGQLRVAPGFCGVDPVEFAAPSDSLHFTSFMGGACVLYRKKALDKAGPYDLRFAPTQNEDVDHGLAVRAAGYDVMILGSLLFIHHSNSLSGCNFGNSMTQRFQRAILVSKWGRALNVLETSLDRYGRTVE